MKEERLIAVFDAAEPDEATLDRMWDFIDTAYDEMAAKAGTVGEGADAGAGGANVESGAFVVTPGGQASRKRSARRGWQLPAVAAALVLAIGVGAAFALNGGGMKSERALSPDAAEPVVTEASGGASRKDFEADEYDAYSAMPAPEPTFAPEPEPAPAPEPNAAADGAAAGETESVDGGVVFLTGDDGRRYSARTLLVAVDEAMTSAQRDALCAKFGVSLKYDWGQWIVVELDHDATVDELAQLFAALSAEPGVLGVEYDWETAA